MRHINRGDQYVVACVENTDTAPAVIAAASHFATHLRHKKLMLLNVSNDNSDSNWLKQYNIPYAALRGDWATAIEGLPTAFNAILAVTAANPSAPRSSITNPRTLLRTFARCKTAYLVIRNEELRMKNEEWADAVDPHPDNSSFFILHSSLKKAVITVDHHRESKEKLIWASYLARFLGTSLTIALPSYNDQGLRSLQNNNIRYIDKIFPPLGIKYEKTSIFRNEELRMKNEELSGCGSTASAHSSFSTLLSSLKNHSSLTSPDLQAIDSLHPDILVALTTDPRNTDPIDWIFGTPDRRLLTHPSATPILFLNPRDDLYILCD